MNKFDVDWRPTLRLGHEKIDVDALEAAQERATRIAARRKKIDEATIQSEITVSNLDPNTKEVQTDSIMVTHLSTAVQTESNSFFSETEFLSDEVKVHYYTGLPNAEVLQSTFEFVVAFYAKGEKRRYYWLSFLIVLIKLRLNLGFQDLAFRMDVSLATIGRRFHEMLDMMVIRLKFLVQWPEREQLCKTMPMCFRAVYGTKVVAVIDCYEIKIEKPSHLVAKAATWSQYKHSNTAKIFIGISPQGVTTFISPAWGGRVSDKHLTVNSGFLNKLLPGDIILADRGFDIAEDVARMQACLKIPAFTKGCLQLSPKDIEVTRHLANVRIHVERVIGATRQKYSILMSTLPINFVKPGSVGETPTIDKIVLVCSALNNLCISVVPFE